MKYLFVLSIFFINLTTLFSQKIKPEKLQNDFNFLVEELRLKHQGLYQYETHAVIDGKIDSLYATLSKPHSKIEFYTKVRALIALTNEGHTYADLPKGAMVKAGISRSFLPLSIRYCDKQLIIDQYFGESESKLKQGLRILSINGKDVDEIVQDIFPYIPSDGFNETSKYEWSANVIFSLLYRLVYGAEKKFILEVEEFEKRKPFTVELPAVRFTKFKVKHAKYPFKKFEFKQFKFQILNDSVAYMSVPSFDSEAASYSSFYGDCFEKVTEKDIKHLIIDLQDNGGGSEGNENLLYSYLQWDIFPKYKSVSMTPIIYNDRKNENSIKFDKWEHKGQYAERGDFTLSSSYYSTHSYQKPDKAHVYDGKLYVLISGATFSGGAEFCSMVKMNNRGIFIGEETGGTFEGNVSGYAENIKLPNTKIRVSIPVVNFRMNVDPAIKGRGIMPDFEVPQNWEDYLSSENSKLKFVLEDLLKIK